MSESIGIFYVLKSSTHKTGWRLLRESWSEGERSQKSVPKTAWGALGFTDTMTLEQARARAHQLNSQNAIKRQEAQTLAKIANRVERDRLNHSAFVPEDLNQAFLKWLDNNGSGSEKHQERLRIHWSTSKKIIISLGLTSEQFAENKKQFYRYLSNQEYSLDYANKLIQMVNRFGRFTSKLVGKFFEEIPSPTGHDREMINDAYFNSDGYIGPSEALTPDCLEDLKRHLSVQQYNWLYMTVHFGLRPSEADMVLEDRTHKTWRVEEGEVDVLWVYQPKLTSKPRALRWKPIPILYPEQREALEIVYKGDAAKPLAKTIKKYTGAQITLYGGRKGFTDLMLDRGQDLEAIAQWLGHTSIEMTWTRYKDRTKVTYKKPP